MQGSMETNLAAANGCEYFGVTLVDPSSAACAALLRIRLEKMIAARGRAGGGAVLGEQRRGAVRDVTQVAPSALSHSGNHSGARPAKRIRPLTWCYGCRGGGI